MDSALSPDDLRVKSPAALSTVNLARIIELLCLGGGSLVIMAFCFSLGNIAFLLRDDVRGLLAQCAALALLFTALLSYPHTMWSYRFAYGQGVKFVLKHSWQLIGYPLIILSLLYLAAGTWAKPVTDIALLSFTERSIAAFGIDLNWSKYDSLGQLILASLLVLQIIMSGYHYGMQAMGCAIACGERRGYQLQTAHKRYLRFNLYALWLINLLSGYTFLSLLDSDAFGYQPVRFPIQWQTLAGAIFAVSIVLLIIKVIVPIFKESGKLPPLASQVSMLSVWLWLQPFAQPYGFQAGVVPLAHGLQYLYFSARGEALGFDQKVKEKTSDKQLLKWAWTMLLFVALVAAGFITYRHLPTVLDNTYLVKNMTPNFFIISAYIFLNTHHFMIDSIVWRGDSRLRNIMPSLTAA